MERSIIIDHVVRHNRSEDCFSESKQKVEKSNIVEVITELQNQIY